MSCDAESRVAIVRPNNCTSVMVFKLLSMQIYASFHPVVSTVQPIFSSLSCSSYLLEPLAPERDQLKKKNSLFFPQVIASAWAPAQTRKTRVACTWTLPRPETTCTSGSVASACWPGKRGTGARWRKTAFDRRRLHPSCTTPSTSAASWVTRSKVCT